MKGVKFIILALTLIAAATSNANVRYNKDLFMVYEKHKQQYSERFSSSVYNTSKKICVDNYSNDHDSHNHDDSEKFPRGNKGTIPLCMICRTYGCIGVCFSYPGPPS